MGANPVAEVVAEIANRERKSAVKEGDYVWAFICAIVEGQARTMAEGNPS